MYSTYTSASRSSRSPSPAAVFRSLSNRRSIKALASATLIILGFGSFLIQCSTWSPGSRRVRSVLDTAMEVPITMKQDPPSRPATPEEDIAIAEETITTIPEKIWYKAGPKGINNEIREWMNTFLEQNPTFEHQIMTDSSANAYVVERFVHRPDIVETYLALTIPILKADLLRYLLLFADGGLWSDLDVSCEGTPIRDWIPEEYKKNASLVVGWEFQTVEDKQMREFTSWMIMAKPGLRHMSMVINDTMEALPKKAEENNVPLSGLTMAMVGDIVWLTGSMAMSKSIIKSLGIENHNINYGTTPYVFEPQLFDDVLILPGYSFSASLQDYKDDEHPGPALVTHHFTGSWKNDIDGEVGNVLIQAEVMLMSTRKPM